MQIKKKKIKYFGRNDGRQPSRPCMQKRPTAEATRSALVCLRVRVHFAVAADPPQRKALRKKRRRGGSMT